MARMKLLLTSGSLNVQSNIDVHVQAAVDHVGQLGTDLEVDVTRRDDLLGFQLALQSGAIL